MNLGYKQPAGSGGNALAVVTLQLLYVVIDLVAVIAYLSGLQDGTDLAYRVIDCPGRFEPQGVLNMIEGDPIAAPILDTVEILDDGAGNLCHHLFGNLADGEVQMLRAD